MKLYVVAGTGFSDWENHFILPKCYSKREIAEDVANSTKIYNGDKVMCYVKEVELVEIEEVD